MAQTFKILPQLDDKNRARLEAKTYNRIFTDIPNRALPEAYKTALSAIFQALTGEEFQSESTTFTVRADKNGTFQKVLSPSVFATEDENLMIRWGEKDIPIQLSEGKIQVPSGSSKGVKISFKDEQIGRYSEPVLSVSVTQSGNVYSLPVPIRRKELTDQINADLLEMLLEENPKAIVEKVQLAPDPSKRGENTSYERMVGHYIKISSLPVGEYTVTACRAKDGGNFGREYFLQVQIPEPFSAPVRVQVDGQWVEQEAEIVDWAIVKPNSSIKKILAAEPNISPETPAVLKVLEHFEYNGNPAVKAAMKCGFQENPDSFDLDF